ncbi:hypothetical protein E2C01_050226 [Portunus trituberculatus]|uniref:Uncharacterized protein n=1 Tax=Portunus trituberculatus TaxID=210409 RepID=A0A5B7GFY6_PORTR|nr:hypothetical protein [Portunus trituberculatus]
MGQVCVLIGGLGDVDVDEDVAVVENMTLQVFGSRFGKGYSAESLGNFKGRLDKFMYEDDTVEIVAVRERGRQNVLSVGGKRRGNSVGGFAPRTVL